MRATDQAFFLSLFLSRLADQILLFLVPLVIFQQTQSVAWSGLTFFLETLPRYLAFPVCGALCDRISPVRLLRISQLWRALACLAGIGGYGIGGYLALGGIGWLVGLSAVCGVLTTQGLMAREVMLPQIFPGRRFEAVVSYSQIADQMGLVLGPVLAALLLDWWPWEVVVGGTAALFLLADGAMILWQRVSHVRLADPEPPPGHWLAPLRIAAGHVLHLPGLKAVVALAAGVNLVIGATLATSAAMVTGLHDQSAAHYAALQFAGAVATILILLAIARLAIPPRLLGSCGFVAILAGGLVTGLSPDFPTYAAGFLLVVGFDKMFSVYIRSLRQRLIPLKDFGKTTGVIVLLNNLSQPLAGLLVGLSDQAPPIIIGLSLAMGAIGAGVAVAGGRSVRARL